MAEALSHSGVDWLCLDTQHGAVGYAELAGLLQATASGRAQTIVRVGGPTDRFGIQQALDQGAGGIMVPLVNSVEEAREAVSYCRFPPEGQRSLVAPSRAILLQEGIGGGAAGRYLRAANRRVQVWLQVESVQCLEALDSVLGSVPGIDCMFLGPADMAVSMGLLGGCGDGAGVGGAGAAAADDDDGAGAGAGADATGGRYTDLAAALAGPEMARVHEAVLQACERHGVAAGCFCVGAARARELAALGYRVVGFDVDVNMVINAAAAAVGQLKLK
ncbi:hypothetical protein PLESTF_001115100 [Pleodorina starrii]|nr:hypothetical protein PLESTM_001834300 [Pleodorina starrii]GLC71430.1 hypothetical protein PLESTF_001115100 [Pleodorina starrii]